MNNTWKELLTSESYQTKGKIVFHQELFAFENKLWQASHDNDVHAVRKLLSCVMVNVNCEIESCGGAFISTPLHQAACQGNKEVVKVLLDGGADPYMEERVRRGVSWTALELAILYSKHDVIRVLTSKGVDPNKPNKRGETPLHTWLLGHYHAVEVLLEVGAHPNKADVHGNTPLHLAARWGYYESVKLLLQKGADHTKANKDGDTALSLARESRDNGYKSEIVYILQFPKLSKII